MSNEKTGNAPGWSAKLEDAGNLPTEILQDKSAAWEKLYRRLQPQKKKKKMGWYWAAAACLLAVTAIPFLLNIRDVKNPEQPVAVNKRVPETRIHLIVTDHSAERNTIAPVVAAKRQNRVYPRGEGPLHNSIAAENKRSPITSIIEDLHAIDTAVTAEKTVQLLAAAPAKEIKKLKIVHLNELGSPVMQSDETHYASARPSHFNFLKQLVFSDDPYRSTRHALSITNKISPQN